MLYHFLYPLVESNSFFNVFKYISLRASIAFIISSIFSIFIGKYFIRFMAKKQFGQVVRDEGPESHHVKRGTPTMGGIFIYFSVLFAVCISGNFNSPSLLALLFVFASYTGLGFLDDYLKVLKKNTVGIPGKLKILWQLITSVLVLYWLISVKGFDTNLYLPFLKNPVLDLGMFYIAFGSFVIVGASNAVNLTDGLDGLAIGPIITSSLTLCVLAYLSGHKEIADYLLLPHLWQVGELSVAMTAIIGAGIGFLWYNSYPAQVFMGDVGSLSLGGVIGISSILTKSEFLLIIYGGIFVVEALSVIIQVTSYKIRRKRVFRMAPIHHHFELGGWSEPKVIVRFWIISLVLSIIALATLKIR
jgi:phospho-N-acetylmuramoyl-pentapeptide-transferase